MKRLKFTNGQIFTVSILSKCDNHPWLSVWLHQESTKTQTAKHIYEGFFLIRSFEDGTTTYPGLHCVVTTCIKGMGKGKLGLFSFLSLMFLASLCILRLRYSLTGRIAFLPYWRPPESFRLMDWTATEFLDFLSGGNQC